jgi:DNA-binding beta-propeller fold protein YncE
MIRTTLVVAAALGLSAAAQADVIVAGYAEGSIRHYLDNGTQLPPITAGTVFGAAGMDVGTDGFLYVSCQTSLFGPPGTPDNIFRVNPITGAISPFITLASGYVPAGIRFSPIDGDLYVSRNGGQGAAMGTGRVDRYNGITGAFVNTVVSNLTQPTGLLFNSGNLYVSNFGEGNVVRFNGMSSSVFTSGGGLAAPTGLVFGADGRLYVADTLAGSVLRFNGTTGVFDSAFIAPGGALLNQFPADLLFDQVGQLLIANLGSSFNPNDPPNLHGNVMAFNGTTGAFIGNFATDILGASQILQFTPIPEPGSFLLVGSAAVAFAWWRKKAGRRETQIAN